MSVILINGYEQNERVRADLINPSTLLYKLAKYYSAQGYTMKPFEEADDPREASALLFLEMPVQPWPNFKYFVKCCAAHCQNKMISWLMESPTHFPWVWKDQNLHNQFAKILTWNDRMIDNEKYIKLYYGQNLKVSPKRNVTFAERKLITLIATNKTINHPYELFSERREAIRAFERLCPYEFDIFGLYWNQPTYGIWWNQRLAERAYDFLIPQFPCAQGNCVDKIETLTGYKFCISYENMISSPEYSGYITEKIFDCFFAGCVPIYLGDMQISNVIPPDTFIHRANFRSYDQLYGHIINMSETTWEGYRKRAQSYFESEVYKTTFSEERFLRTMIATLNGIINQRS